MSLLHNPGVCEAEVHEQDLVRRPHFAVSNLRVLRGLVLRPGHRFSLQLCGAGGRGSTRIMGCSDLREAVREAVCVCCVCCLSVAAERCAVCAEKFRMRGGEGVYNLSSYYEGGLKRLLGITCPPRGMRPSHRARGLATSVFVILRLLKSCWSASGASPFRAVLTAFQLA